MDSRLLNSFTKGAYTYEQRLVPCGKKACGKCPHGPYWYLIIQMRTGKKVKKYLGKELPADVQESAVATEDFLP